MKNKNKINKNNKYNIIQYSKMKLSNIKHTKL